MGQLETDKSHEAVDGLPGFTTPVEGGSDAFSEVAARYQRELIGLIDDLDVATLHRIADRLREARDRGATIFIAGNGGSAATARTGPTTWARPRTAPVKPPFRVLSLSDNVSWFTALANDEGSIGSSAANSRTLGSQTMS